MEIVHMILNFTLLPATVVSLFLLAPLLIVMRWLYWSFRVLFPENIRNKVVVITGASSGIGRAVAFEYARRGAKLVLAARREEELRLVANQAIGLGAADALVIPADVTKEEDCKHIIQETMNRFRRLDHLVNNAGVAHSFSMEETASQEVTHIMDVNFWGNIYPTYYALPHLRRFRGRIIANASTLAFLPFPRTGIYNASKAAVLNFYDTLRVEVGNDVGITVVAPGWIESEMTAGKVMSALGSVKFDKVRMDEYVGPFPVESVRVCASAMVNGALRGQSYVIVPYWYTIWLYYRVFAPDILDSTMRLLYASPAHEAPMSKKVVDFVGEEALLRPESIQKAD
eukprot:TRINITY_DN18289_c0_g1_i2.p1 TRINITY_DN18289_c0_g1~~TRINITY_DN18289_c0_g1_i2.p1  ORF type:complete len:342 (-),score=75.89 TRINITY_DN18289_c0_g1_i2:69-1094(-)